MPEGASVSRFVDPDTGTEWRPVPSEPGYWASSLGQIKGPSGRVLRSVPKGHGHLYVTANGNRSRAVHQLVAEAFIGPKPDEPNMVVLHADDDPTNNAPDNLSWGSQAKNVQDSYLRGRRPTKLDATIVLQIRSESATTSQCKLAERYGVARRTIQQIMLRQTWSHI